MFYHWLGAQADYDPDILLSCETLNEALCGIVVDLTDPQADE
jgi:hypothetical protein